MHFLFYTVLLVKTWTGKGKEMKNKLRSVNLLKKGKTNCIYFWEPVKSSSVADVCYLICILKIIGVFLSIHKHHHPAKFVCYSLLPPRNRVITIAILKHKIFEI